MDIFWNYTFQVVILPPSPEISVIIQLGWVPPGKNICVKNVVTLYYYAKDNCYKIRKNPFIHVNYYHV